LARNAWLIFASGAYAALLVVIRGRPSLKSDAGIFLSVAGRLLDGDRLYVDVLDNKDPLFYYSHAAALAIGDWRAPFLLDVVWLAIAAGSTLLLLRAIGASRLAAAVGFVCLPLLLTGAWYLAGYSMLAALSLAPLIAWLWIRGSFALAGGLLCVGLLFKVNLALVLISAPVAFLLLGVPAGPARSQAARAAAGFGAVLAAGAAILVLRGELYGYLETVIDNVAYSRDVLVETGRRTGILGHVSAAANAVGSPWERTAVASAFLLAGVLAVRTLRARPPGSPGRRGDPAIRTLAALFLCTTVATAATLALTAVWPHHLQMLAYPGFLLIAFLAMVIGGSSPGLPKGVAACASAGLVTVLLGATAGYPAPRGSISTWLGSGRSDTADLLARAAEDRFPRLKGTTFAHLGQNDEQAVGAFLDKEYVLACPTIAQYVYSPELSGVSRCIRDEQPQLLLVTPSFRPRTRAPAEWNRLVAHGSHLLSEEYEPALTREAGNGLIEVWTLRDRREWRPLASRPQRPGLTPALSYAKRS
jgi:hypothetical protein